MNKMNNSIFIKRFQQTLDQLYDEVVQVREKVLSKQTEHHALLDRIERIKFDIEDLKALTEGKPFQDSNGPCL